MPIVGLILCWLIAGVLTTAGGFAGALYPVLSLLLLLPTLSIIAIVVTYARTALSASTPRVEKAVFLVIVAVWASHLVQVFTPETGFDAVWYHLPVALADTQAHRFIYVQNLYQSVNPLFSDALFFLGFMAVGDVGTKIVAYLLGVTLIVITYALARTMLSRWWSLTTALTISVFQNVAWQSASFYVDVAKAFWEVAAVWCVIAGVNHIKKRRLASIAPKHALLLSALLFGASLATKLFSLLLIPVFALIWWLTSDSTKRDRRLRHILSLLGISLTTVVPFYAFAFIHTGNPWFAISSHVHNLDKIGGQAQPLLYVLQRAVLLIRSPIDLFFAREYVSPLVVLLVGLIWWGWKNNKLREKTIQIFLIFSAGQWLVWWFVPPLSTRYALSGFIVLQILLMWLLRQYLVRTKISQSKALWIITAVALCMLVPRLVVNARSLRYLLAFQTKQEYLQQFRDGWINQLLDEWHGKYDR